MGCLRLTYQTSESPLKVVYRANGEFEKPVQRFIRTDPWADKYPAWSTYNYCMGNPVVFIDPTGKGVESLHVDKYGRVLKNVDDGDNRVYLHEEACTDSDVEKNYSEENTSAGGRKIGEIGGIVDITTIYANLIEVHVTMAKENYNPFDFKNLVKSNGDWDLKSNMNYIYGVLNDEKTTFRFRGTHMESQDVGNHHFGVVSLAYGLFGEDFILRQAGDYQIKSGTSRKEWQIYSEPETYHDWMGNEYETTPVMLPPYGDDPRDQKFIKQGFQYYKNRW